ncbi:hypothetical protein GO986_09100 [Deinococcus sp. HMF7620]|uniref:Uncharacterized protein n=1 Tax=Deinococcus arboris TaxID=2682977 RepID=A0A7C9LQW3_9DEIO|nr:hypothetical protein [Deinococcus arboris]MVN86921.1 hypothetical protein [Deinococcus arboris]
MHRFLLSLMLLSGVALALLVVPPGPPICRLQVVPDYTLGVTSRAALRLSPGCAFGTILRVRKSSTTSTRRNGAPYQPIKPEQGAWEVGATGQPLKSPVPKSELWTLYSWRWEYNAAKPGQPERWRPGEVLRAAP